MERDPGELVQAWIRAGLTGCVFAATAAGKKSRLAVDTYPDALLPQAGFDDLFDEYARRDLSVVQVFPQIVTESALIAFLKALRNFPRWSITRRERTTPRGDALIGIEWATANGDMSEVMGFGPFPTMPVPRRAPHFALALWPGARRNPLRGTPPTPPPRTGVVSFLDSVHDLDAEPYEQVWIDTTLNVKSMMATPADKFGLYRTVAFAISSNAADQLFA